MASTAAMWEYWASLALAGTKFDDYLSYLPKVCLPQPSAEEDPFAEDEALQGPGPWDRTLLDVEVEDPQAPRIDGEPARKKLVLFSGNDYLNLSSHPAVRKATARAAVVFGMGPRASNMISGSTDYHRRLENLLAEMHRKEACVLCPTGFAANTAIFAALGSLASHIAQSKRLTAHEKIAVFSDALNHASIIDGLRMMERGQQAVVSVNRHSDMRHLDELLSKCTVEKKVVITDGLFSMEGDFAPMKELVQLRSKHGFLLVVDEAHTIFVCGNTGCGIGEVYGIQDQMDVIVGALSKAAGCLGGYVACSKNFADMVRGMGRPNMFTTTLPLPVVAAAYAAAVVAKKEGWRRQELWNKIKEFAAITKHPANSPIVPLVIGTEEAAIRASKHMLDRGFHVTAIRPPAVAPDTCRLRVTLTMAHTSEDLRRLAAALAECIPGLSSATDDIVARL